MSESVSERNLPIRSSSEHTGECARRVAVSLKAGLVVKGLEDMTKPKKVAAKAKDYAFEKVDFVVECNGGATERLLKLHGDLGGFLEHINRPELGNVSKVECSSSCGMIRSSNI